MIDLRIVDVIFIIYMMICVAITLVAHVKTKGDISNRWALVLGILWILFVIFAFVILYLHGVKPRVILLS